MTEHVKWPSIDNFKNVHWHINSKKEYLETVIAYVPKVKLHGTNAAIQIFPDGKVVAQSRNRILSREEDNHGFCAFVGDTEDYWASLSKGNHLTVFGEWVDPKMHKEKTATQKLDDKYFFPFLVIVDGKNLIFRDEELASCFGDDVLDSVRPIREEFDVLTIDYLDPVSIKMAQTTINLQVKFLSKMDLFIHEEFGVDGPAEGLVYYPLMHNMSLDTLGTYSFKAKSVAFQTTAAKSPAATELPPEVHKNLTAFTDMVTTERRLRQGVEEACKGTFDIKQTGTFVGWVSKDIHKECQAELAEAKLEWKNPLLKYISTKAANWFITRCREGDTDGTTTSSPSN